MASKAAKIDVPQLALNSCSVDEHCGALGRIKKLPFWWYQGTSKLFGNFSIPFRDGQGNWWYQVKPGLCWAVDCFRPFSPDKACPGFTKSYLGYQHVVPEEDQANSHLVINAVTDLSQYGASAINAKRRNAVRKGFKMCELEVLREPDETTFDECRIAWDELTQRTGWKHTVDKAGFDKTWWLLLDCPGVSIIIGRERESGQVAGFLITKIIGQTAYVDTIASRSDMLHTNVNDAVMFAFLMAARELPGVKSAHYAIKSNVVHLEKFKTGIGFTPVPFPAVTHLRGVMPFVLRAFFADKYRRMIGQF